MYVNKIHVSGRKKSIFIQIKSCQKYKTITQMSETGSLCRVILAVEKKNCLPPFPTCRRIFTPLQRTTFENKMW